MKFYRKIIIMLVCFYSHSVLAQSDSSTKKSHFKVDLNYLSNSVYFGRKDSSIVPYLRSSFGYYNKSGIFFSAGTSLLLSPGDTRVDVINTQAGYNFSRSNFDGGINVSKFFYSNASYAVQSELKGIVGINVGYDLGLLSVSAGGDLIFSTNTDLGISIGLSHSFEFVGEKNKWTFNPTAELNGGTQYFNEAYYEFRKFTFTTAAAGNSGSGSNNSGKGRGHSSGSISGSGGSNSGNGISTTTTTVKTVTFYNKNKFAILDYEISLPVNYEIGQIGLYINPVFAVPLSAASYAIDNTIQKEKLTTSVFVEIGGVLKFHRL